MSFRDEWSEWLSNQWYEWLDAFKWTVKVFLIGGLALTGVVFVLMNLAVGWKAAGASGALAVLTFHAAEFAGYRYARSEDDVLLRFDAQQQFSRKFFILLIWNAALVLILILVFVFLISIQTSR